MPPSGSRRVRLFRLAVGAPVLFILAVLVTQAGSGPFNSPGPTAPATAPGSPSIPPSIPVTARTSEPSITPTPPIEPIESAATAEPAADPATLPPKTLAPVLPISRVATRVQVPELGIDLPVMRQETPYPACDVAMYILELKQPGQGGVTYLYAHAQVANFLRLFTESLVNDGQRMLGMTVQVYTGDNLRFTYRISEVRRHVTDLDAAFAWTGESVWLQTSEGLGVATPKLQVIAEFVSSAPTDYASAHPVPRPTACT